jgi:imidazole glycerol-phosphate synthase subunit HisH
LFFQMKIAIIKYNAGNIRSVLYALERLGFAATVTDDRSYIKKADKVIFPGVGEASSTMTYLRNKRLDVLIRGLKQPVLGICLGQQLMCDKSEEGNTDCIGIFNVPVVKFEPIKKVPHMGWNKLYNLKGDLFNGLWNDNYVYFVHSFYVPLSKYTIADCDYILEFSAAMQNDNFFSTQFHPEKSGEVGQMILKNFINL